MVSSSRFGARLGATNIHDTAVDIAKFLEAEEPRAMCGVIESKGLNRNTHD